MDGEPDSAGYPQRASSGEGSAAPKLLHGQEALHIVTYTKSSIYGIAFLRDLSS